MDAGVVAAWVGGLAIALLVVFLVWFYSCVARRNRALGGSGIVSRSRVSCSHCGETFDYDYVPGASFTAVRLGKGRYMACPLCRRWGYFDLSSTAVARTSVEPPKAA